MPTERLPPLPMGREGAAAIRTVMEYVIRHELPGRLRLRLASHARFTEGQGVTLEELLTQRLSCLKRVEACATNGSLLLCFPPGQRKDVLGMLSATEEPATLPETGPRGQALARRQDRHFQRRLAMMCLRHLVMRFIVPSWLTLPLALLRYRRHLMEGLRFLCRLRLDVPVLDAVSIGLSLAMREYRGANSIMFLLGVSDLLQQHTLQKARGALKESLSLNIDHVWQLREGTEVSVSPGDISVGDLIVVRAGSMIPMDGVVESGEAEVNETYMTGESAPAAKRPGLMAYAGTTVETGLLVLRVQSIDSETRISRIMALIDNAETLKARVQARAEHLADCIVPYSLAAAAATWLLTRSATRAMAVLTVDYSCALKLSTPITVSAAMRDGANRGLIIKGGKYLEAVAEADTIVFDKTGTLTTAEPSVVKIIAFEPYAEDEVLRHAACIEEHFPHSMARAIVNEAARRGLRHEEQHAEVNYVVAHGVNTTLHGCPALVGSAHYVLEDEQVQATPEQLDYIRRQTNGHSVIYLAIGGKLAGCICLSDTLRPEAPEVIAGLRRAGITRIIMLTGDSRNAAESVARKLGVDEFRAQVLPEQKADIIRELKAQGHCVIMVGDGVNDSPAMSVADAAISMKDSADLAREVSDITLAQNSLESLPELRQLATAAMLRVRQHYRFITGFNSSLIGLASLGTLTPVLAAFLHNASTVGVCAMSMRPMLPQQKAERLEHQVA